MTSKRNIRKRLSELEDDARSGDAPEPWMADLPRELWGDPEKAWRWCLRNDRQDLAGQAYFRILKATYGHLRAGDPAASGEKNV